jgi:hypothetical protein
MKGDIITTQVTYTSPYGSVHIFNGADCWERAVKFKERLEKEKGDN